MITSIKFVAGLSEQELLDHFTSLVDRDRRTTVELLVAIAEIDERKIWAKHACSSMFTFCMERFHMSEQMTAKRLWAARTARQFPVILEMVARGELHLGAVHLLAKHLTAENHVAVLERAKHKSCRDVERLVAELAPRADVASRIRAMPGGRGAGADVEGTAAGIEVAPQERAQACSVDVLQPTSQVSAAASGRVSAGSANSGRTKPIVPLSPRRYKIEITVDEATHDRLRSLQDLLGRSETGRDPAAIISRAIEVLLDRMLARKAGCTDRPRSPKNATDAPASHRRQRSAAASDATASQRAPRSSTIPVADGSQAEPPGKTAAAAHAGPTAGQRSRTIPAAVRREVWQRDCGRCRYVDAKGGRCHATSNVEFHHRDPFAMGGAPTPENIELRCAAHNQYQADLDFGRSFMDGRRSKNVVQTTFHVECRDSGEPLWIAGAENLRGVEGCPGTVAAP